MPKWSAEKGLHPQGISGVAHCINGVNFYHGSYCSKAARERQMVRCYDVPSMFVNTDVNEDILMVLKRELMGMMEQITLQIYRKYISVEKKGTKILYVKLQKVLYGLMRASLLFYRKPHKKIEEYGLVVNPYNLCRANMITKSQTQLTVVWHVDNLMALCKDNFELTKFSCYLGKIYGPNLSMHTGKKHDYLGVDMEFNEDGMLDVSMIMYGSESGSGPSVFGQGLQRGKDTQEREGACIPSYSSAAAVHVYHGKERYTDGSGIPDYQSERTRHG